MNYRQPPGWRNLRVGAFFLLSTVILLGFLFVVGTNQHLFTRHYDLVLHLSNTQGLAKGAQVTLSGLEVGRVSDIRFVDLDTTRALEVIMAIERGQRQRITSSSVATIRTVGVLGDKFVDISLGDPTLPPLPDGSSLPVRGEIDWTETFARATGAIDDLTAFLQKAGATLDSLNTGGGSLALLLNDRATADRLRRATGDLASVTRSLRSGDGAAARLLTDPTTARKLDGILTRLDRLTAEADSGSGALARLVRDPELGERLQGLIAGSDSLVADIRGQGTTGRLIRDENLYEEMTTTLTELRTLLEDMKQNPRKYLKVSVF
jgi:phospholipid/cholesterol/gamma-HCH transport system substrate-binding protein